MGVKPYTWVSWSKARSRMPEIWHGWSESYMWGHANEAMVNALRSGNVPFRGSAVGSDLPLVVPLKDVVDGLLNVIGDRVEYGKPGLSSGYRGPPRVVAFQKTATLSSAELAWEPFRDYLIQSELPAGVMPDPDPAERAEADQDQPRRRAAYKGALAEWMAPQNLNSLWRMDPEEIAAAFRTHCKAERPDLLPLFPRRLRDMAGTIKQIIAGRAHRTQAAEVRKAAIKGQ